MVAAAFNGVNGGTGEAGAIYSGVDDALTIFGTGGNQGDNMPGAYLNYILFDAGFNVLDAGWERVPSAALNAMQKISIPTVEVT